MIYLLLLLSSFVMKLPAGESVKETPKVVIFDFGGVVGYLDHHLLAQLISKTFDLPEGEACKVVTSYLSVTKTGKSDEAFWTEYAKTMGKPLPKEWFQEWQQQMISAVTEIPGMKDLVLELQTEGVQTALLSNVTFQKAAAIRARGFYDLFHPVILSYEVSLRKPDPKIFDLLLKRLNKPAKECLFIDDKLANVEAAREKGIDSIQFQGVESLTEELRQRGLLHRVVKLET